MRTHPSDTPSEPKELLSSEACQRTIERPRVLQSERSFFGGIFFPFRRPIRGPLSADACPFCLRRSARGSRGAHA